MFRALLILVVSIMSLPAKEPDSLLLKGPASLLPKVFSTLPMEIVYSLQTVGIYLIKIPAGFTKPEFVKKMSQDFPEVILEENQELIPVIPSPSEGSSQFATQGSQVLDYLNQKFGVPRRQIKVAILDTGISPHTDLPTVIPLASRDLNGHGTHIAGTIAALRNNRGIDGLAERVKLLSYPVLNAKGEGKLLSLLAGIVHALADKADIINLSLGSTSPSRILDYLLELAAERCLLVAAAGNMGNVQAVTPASHPNVIGIGSIDNITMKRSSFSNYGPNASLFLYGEDVLSTWPQNAYRTLSGTSMAAAQFTGLMAAIFSRLDSNIPAHGVQMVTELYRANALKRFDTVDIGLELQLFSHMLHNYLQKNMGQMESPLPADAQIKGKRSL